MKTWSRSQSSWQTQDTDLLRTVTAAIRCIFESPPGTHSGRRVDLRYTGNGTSVTGDILARAADHKATRNAGNLMMYSNRVTNQADARRILAKWAELLRDRLDEFHGK